MTVVFRIRTAAGQELSFASREMFEDFVRSGDLSPEDLVYDGETGSWAPARTHPVVLDVQYELEEAEEARAAAEASVAEEAPTSEEGGKDEIEAAEPAEPETSLDADAPAEADAQSEDQAAASASGDVPTLVPEAKDATSSGASASEGSDLGLDLAVTEELSPEDEQRAFLEKLEAERHHDVDAGPSIRDSISGFTTDTLAPRDKAPPRAPDPPPRPKPQPKPRIAKPAPKPSGGVGKKVAFLALAVIVVGGAYAGYVAWSGEPPTEVPDPDQPDVTVADPQPTDPEPDPDPVVTDSAVEPPLEPVIADTPGAVRERAQERYLAGTQTALRSLQPIPEVWPDGPYLTVPSDHPEVVDIWQDYRSTIREVREADTDRYRTAYEDALDDAAVTGEARVERLQRAMDEFALSAELRAAHFDRVDALATAALQSHNALVEAEGLILHDPTGSTGRASGIGEGTSGRNAEAQLLLDQVIELLEGALDADGEGPGSGENVREWVWDGFLDAVTR